MTSPPPYPTNPTQSTAPGLPSSVQTKPYGFIIPIQQLNPPSNYQVGGVNPATFSISPFEEAFIRHKFIRKVYSILLVNLLVAAGIVTFFIYYEPAARFVKANFWLFILAMILEIVLALSISCCPALARKTPYNYILLIVFNLVTGFLLGVTSSFYSRQEILYAVVITVSIVLVLTLFAIQTKLRFTVCMAMILALVVIMLIVGIFVFIYKMKVLIMVVAGIGALVFSMLLVVNTQMIIGGKHSIEFSPEDYIFAALILYTDIISIFRYILCLTGLANDG